MTVARRVLVAIEGADGVGKSTVADAVAREVGACSWHHDVRPGGEWTMALAFAHARAELCDALTSGARITRGVRVGTGNERVVIADRWTLSAEIRARALVALGHSFEHVAHGLVAAEYRAMRSSGRPNACVMLEVSDPDTWRSRFSARVGAKPTRLETVEREKYAVVAQEGWRYVVDADRPLTEVVADVVAIVREVTL